MCSILAILEVKEAVEELRPLAVKMSGRQRHRGPDGSGVAVTESAVLVHERLAIVDREGGVQPLASVDGEILLVANGEIYNHEELRATLPGAGFRTRSDCEVILELYRRHDRDFLSLLNGIFAFVLLDRARGRWLIGRDPIGVVPLFTGRDREGRFYVASEMKALTGVCCSIEEFPPGCFLDSEEGVVTRWYDPDWQSYDAVVGRAGEAGAIRAALEAAVERQLMSDVPWGVLLSGGLDSSIVASVAARIARERDGEPIRSFAIGLPGSPDLAAARTAAAAIGSLHHQIVYRFEEGIDALAEVIRHIETYDVTTVRASVPMYLMARRIRAEGMRMVLSGEGSDEIFGGYLYFHRAPDPAAFHEETVRKLELLHKYDCVRANKTMAAWGVEARVPFLDRAFLDVAMSFDARDKMVRRGGIEKEILRCAFEHDLPREIVWRQKEQFSDGVGYGWIDGLKALAERRISDRELEAARFRFRINTPATKEAYLYRSIFADHFPDEICAGLVPGGASIACSTAAAIAWDPAFAAAADPSGRAVAVHGRK